MCNTHSFYRQNRPKRGGICVANHTSPIDIVILANDGCYAMVSEYSGSQILVFALFYSGSHRLLCTFIFSFNCMLCSAGLQLYMIWLIYITIDTNEYDFNYYIFHIKQTNNFRTLVMAYVNHINYFDGNFD